MNEYEGLAQSIIIKADELFLLAHGAQDPGQEYFGQLLTQLRCLFDLISTEKEIDRRLAHALYILGYHIYHHYEAAARNGHQFRDTLFDPDIFALEMAAESVFSDEWSTYSE